MSALGVTTVILGFSVANFVLFIIYFNNQLTKLDNNSTLSKYILSSTIYITYIIVVALLSVLPLKKRKEDALAGILSLIMAFTTIFTLEFCGIQAIEYITTQIYYLSMSAFIVSTILSILLYVKTIFVPTNCENPTVIGASWIETFYLGKDTRPYLFGKLDLKMYSNRIAVVTLLILDVVFLYKSRTETVNTTLIAVIVFRIIYAADAVILESVFETSMEIQKEGFGYQSVVSYQVYPFLMAVMTHYIHHERIGVESWRLFIMIICFVVGYTLYRISNDQMYAYRKNPSSVPAHGLISTEIKDKKLFCFGLWGWVRHPNYLGDILIQISFSCCKLWTPALIMYVDIIFMIHRSYKDNEGCKIKYGRAWEKYCEKVRYILVPFVF